MCLFCQFLQTRGLRPCQAAPMWHWTSVCAWPLSWLVLLDRLWSVQTKRTTLKPIVSARVVWKPLKAIVKISIKMTNIDEPTKNLIEDKFKLSGFGCKLKSSCKLQTAAWNKVKDVKVKKQRVLRVFLTFKRWKQRVFHFPISPFPVLSAQAVELDRSSRSAPTRAATRATFRHCKIVLCKIEFQEKTETHQMISIKLWSNTRIK